MYEVGLEFEVWSLVFDLFRSSKYSKVTVMVETAKSIFQVANPKLTSHTQIIVFLVSKCTVLSSKEAKVDGEN